MVKLKNTFKDLQSFHALVVGDFMLDTYTTGRVNRISPEAPVPIMEVEKHESRAGGAGNVALNLMALGARVSLLGRVGDDRFGIELRQSLHHKNAVLDGLFIEPNYSTIVKNRLIADSQQLLRLDYETKCKLSKELESAALEYFRKVIDDVQVVAISDYAKGFLTRHLIEQIIALSRERCVPVIVDPKGIDFTKYRGATVLKPNLSEAYSAVQMPIETPLNQVAEQILNHVDVDHLLITRSDQGISLFDRNRQRSDFPAKSREVTDVTGAGDVVLAVISAGLANGLEMGFSSELANIAAGIAIEHVGCVSVGLSEIASRLLEYDRSKIYDDRHAFALEQVLKDATYFLLILGKNQTMSTNLFKAIRLIDRPSNEKLLVYVQDTNPDKDLVDFLFSLQEVNFLILKSENGSSLWESIPPKQIYIWDQQTLSRSKSPRELLIQLQEISLPTMIYTETT